MVDSRNRINYGEDFEKLWKSLEQGRLSSRKEMGYKVFKRMNSNCERCFIEDNRKNNGYSNVGYSAVRCYSKELTNG